MSRPSSRSRADAMDDGIPRVRTSQSSFFGVCVTHFTSPMTVLRELCALVRGRTVFALTGAGLSTESGIPTTGARPRSRRCDGPSTGRSSCDRRRCAAVLGAVGPRLGTDATSRSRTRVIARSRRSNARCVAHVITQNVDRLHRKGGSRKRHRAARGTRRSAMPRVRRHRGSRRAAGPHRDAEPGMDLVDVADRAGWRRGSPAPIASSASWSRPVRSAAACSSRRVVFFGDNVPRAVVDEAFAAVEARSCSSSWARRSRSSRAIASCVERSSGRSRWRSSNRGPVRGEEHAFAEDRGESGRDARRPGASARAGA